MELSAKERGYVAELTLALDAKKRGFTVLTTGGDNCPFDLVLLSPTGQFYKIQVKSCQKKEPTRDRYTFTTKCGGSPATYRAYGPTEVDFLALYVAPEKEWYFVPLAVVAGLKTVKVDAGGKLEQFKNNWTQFT